MEVPYFVEDSNYAILAPILASTVEQLDENADKFDHIMAFFIALLAEKGYRVSCLYDPVNNKWKEKVTCIPKDWKQEGTNVYAIDFMLFNRIEIGCKLIGVHLGDWMVLNLAPKRTSQYGKTRCTSINVSKYVNLYQKELGKFWHLKELALKFKNELFAPLHGEMLMEIGIASPSLQGLPEELKHEIVKKLDRRSQYNLGRTCEEFRSLTLKYVKNIQVKII